MQIIDAKVVDMVFVPHFKPWKEAKSLYFCPYHPRAREIEVGRWFIGCESRIAFETQLQLMQNFPGYARQVQILRITNREPMEILQLAGRPGAFWQALNDMLCINGEETCVKAPGAAWGG